MAPQRVLFAAGGSGGHLIPALAVIEALKSESLKHSSTVEVGIVASEKEIDRTILADSHDRVWHLSAVSPSRIWNAPFQMLRNGWSSLTVAASVIREFRPSVVIGCGGFASVPVTLAAFRSRIPVILLEQNVIPGRANSWLSYGASRICLSFAETSQQLPRFVLRRKDAIQCTGNPVRATMRQSSIVPRQLNHLLILGGSQGARHLNAAVSQWILSRPEELRGWRITHQAGAGDQPELALSYAAIQDFCQPTAYGFIPDLLPLYQSATVVIARAGATSLAEMACQGVPSILVPLPTAARNHQLANARWYRDRSAALIVEQSDTCEGTANRLHQVFPSAVASASLLGAAIQQTARPTAAEAVASIILDLRG